MMHLADFTLIRGTKEQLLVSRKRQATAWARGMTAEQFIDREVQLEKFEHAADGKLISWVLVPRSDLQTLEFRCSCETYHRRSLVAKPSGEIEEVIAYSVASVFCPPEYRNKGYASHMMRLLNHSIAPSESLPAFPEEWGAPPPRVPGIGGDARLSILYSYVGDFYKACGPAPGVSGWHIHGPVSTIWRLKPEDPIRINVLDESFYLLSEERCYSLWESDAAYIREHMSKPTESPRTRFTFLPNNGLAAFLIHRTLAETPLLPKHPLGYWGVAVKTQDQESLPSAYATWTLDVALNVPPSLIVTRLRATRESLPALVKGMLGWAQQVGANAVEIWNLDTTLVDVAASLGGSTSRREDNFPAMVWYGPEQPNEIEWIFNEKFAWC